MANFLQPHLSPAVQKLQNSEFARIWDSASCYLSQQLALHQAVRIPRLGAFAVVREQVASKKGVAIVERPVFHLARAIAWDYDLHYDCTDVPGHQRFEPLPYAQIASDNAVSESMVQLCMERTMRLFCVCLENKKSVALVWRDVGMLTVQGEDVKMRFYMDFLKRLNGTDKTLQALLRMPEMRDSVISCHDTAAAQTSSGCLIILPRYNLETTPQMPARKAKQTGHGKATQEQALGKGDGGGKKEDLAEKRLLHRARLSPKRLPATTTKSKQGRKAEGSEPCARQPPATHGSSLMEKEEQEKLVLLGKPRMIDFVAETIERRQKNRRLKVKLPKHIQKYLDGEEEKRELAEERKRRQQTRLAKAKRGEETQRMQESSSSEETPASLTPTSLESGEPSPDLQETMMEEWEEAGEEPPTAHEDNSIPPKRSLSPETHQTLRVVVTCILGQVTRNCKGQRDAQRDLQDKLQCELAVLRWQRAGRRAHSSQRPWEAGPQPAPLAGPRKSRAGLELPRVCPEEGGWQCWDFLRQQKMRAGVAALKA